MQKIVAVGIAALAILAAGYLLLTKHATPLATSTATSTGTMIESVSIRAENINATTSEYIVNVRYPQFGIPTFDAAIKGDVQAAINDLENQAATDKPAEQGMRPYEFYASFDSPYISSDYASVKVILDTDTGGAHGIPVIIGENFDRMMNERVSLDDAVAMTGLTLPQIAAQAKTTVQHDNPDLTDNATFGSGFDPKPENYQAFLVATSTITFIFQPYQVAAYAAGAPEVSLPRTK